MKLLVTGGCGFIGSAVVRAAVGAGHEVVNVDKLTYASTEGSVEPVRDSNAYTFVHADIADAPAMRQVFGEHRPDAVMHLAAESHVDHSIDRPDAFIETNIVGTAVMLEAATRYRRDLDREAQDRFRFHHVSTDEVFGSLGDEGLFTPETAYDPRSPYSASKAAADHLVSAWRHTYGLPAIISNTSNNYGPYQFPEKLIPLMIISAVKGRPLPVYGTGANVRDWLYVEDHAAALLDIAGRGKVGSTYLVGGGAERRNLEVVETICDLLDELAPRPGATHRDAITFVTDRPGHDHRYAIDDSATRDELGWEPTVDLEEGLRRTVGWYLANEDWWGPLIERSGALDRVGLMTEGSGS